MRIIEKQMNAAILSQKDWKNANTEVINIQGTSFVYLHGHLISVVDANSVTLHDAGYQTATTKSRLNAILSAHGAGERIYQRDFVWYISTSEGEKQFQDGMILS